MLALDSTTHTISTLQEKYSHFCQDPTYFDQAPEGGQYDCIAEALQEKKEEVVLTRTKAQTLHTKIQSTISLVRSPPDPDWGALC